MTEIERAVLERARAVIREKPRAVIAIDGRCAAGKSTLAENLCKALHCNVLHMDDFFLRPEQRMPARLSEPGGNVDRERFLSEALLPLHGDADFSFRRYDCQRQALGEEIRVSIDRPTIVEGSYACHPALRRYYDLTVFLSVAPDEQKRRIARRNGEKGLINFVEKWIPMEERYFSAFDVCARCDMAFDSPVFPA